MKTFNKTKERDENQSDFMKRNEESDPYTVAIYSEEWRLVEFHLKSSQPSSEITINNISKIYNQHMSYEFTKRSKEKLNTYAWLQDSTIDLKTIRQKGIGIDKVGKDFIVGSLTDENNEERIGENLNYILCKIIIGKSFCKIIKDNKEQTKYALDNKEYNNIKENGYDSILFCPLDNKSGSSQKSYKYKIFSSYNVLPMYLVNFSYGVSLANRSNKHCFNSTCDEKSHWFCINCNCFLCTNCYNKSHENEKFKNLSHQKVEASKFRNGKCRYHNDKDAEFYCEDCKFSICSYCKVLGSHSNGSAFSHKLKDIEVAVESFKISDNSKILQYCEDRKKKSDETKNRIKKDMIYLQDFMKNDGKIIIEKKFDEEMQAQETKNLETLSKYINIINEMFVLKYIINLFNDYFIKRENELTKFKYNAEGICIWNHHNIFIQQIINNFPNINLEYNHMNEPDTIIISDIYIDKYNIDISNLKEQTTNEINKSINDKQTKQKIDKKHIIFKKTFEKMLSNAKNNSDNFQNNSYRESDI